MVKFFFIAGSSVTNLPTNGISDSSDYMSPIARVFRPVFVGTPCFQPSVCAPDTPISTSFHASPSPTPISPILPE